LAFAPAAGGAGDLADAVAQVLQLALLFAVFALELARALNGGVALLVEAFGGAAGALDGAREPGDFLFLGGQGLLGLLGAAAQGLELAEFLLRAVEVLELAAVAFERLGGALGYALDALERAGDLVDRFEQDVEVEFFLGHSGLRRCAWGEGHARGPGSGRRWRAASRHSASSASVMGAMSRGAQWNTRARSAMASVTRAGRLSPCCRAVPASATKNR